MAPNGVNDLKRACSSLSIDNVCSACHLTFSAPHYLDRHQKFGCKATTQELDELRRQVTEVQQRKRRRLEHSAALSAGADSQETVSPPNLESQEDGTVSSPPSNKQNTGSNNLLPTASSYSVQEPDGGGVAEVTSHLNARNGPGDIGASAVPSSTGAVSHGTQTDTSPSLSDWATNPFRLRKRFDPHPPPRHDPDDLLSTNDLYGSTHHVTTDLDHKNDDAGEPDILSFEPFPNQSSFELGEWFYGQGAQKSLKDFKALVDVLTSTDFSLDDIKTTKWTRVFQDLGKNKEELNPRKSQWVDDAGWKATDVEIEVPIHHRMKEGRGVERHVAGKLFHRSIVSIVEEKIRNAEDSKLFHYSGHQLLWKPDHADSSPEFRVMSELYHSDAFLKAQAEVNQNPPSKIENCQMPRVVVGLMFWSDATHVSTFSTSKLWPLYMLFANESKYRRTKGGSDLCNHVAYFDALSDSFKDYITGRTDGKVPPNLMAHLNREFAHAQWEIILDDELLQAIVEGLVIKCCDGILRRFFIRIFTYSTDYPERHVDCYLSQSWNCLTYTSLRVLMATIKARGDCPCVRCLVRKKNLDQTGTAEDMAFRQANPRVESQVRQESVLKARIAIKSGLAVGGDKVVCFLSNSDVPTVNAFSKRLGHTGFDINTALTVDLLHEFEIGAWKSLFIHLIRILEASASGSTLIHELDRRYRSTPTFNKTIRKFSANASGLKRRAARDYEDLLQCAIPVFDGLLAGPLNNLVLKLLFLNARWHALAKLRMQNEATVALLEEATTQMGNQYRKFAKDTAKINTIERPSEADKRSKAANKKQGRKKTDTSHPSSDTTVNPPTVSTATSARPAQTSDRLNQIVPLSQQRIPLTSIDPAYAIQPWRPGDSAPVPPGFGSHPSLRVPATRADVPIHAGSFAAPDSRTFPHLELAQVQGQTPNPPSRTDHLSASSYPLGYTSHQQGRYPTAYQNIPDAGSSTCPPFYPPRRHQHWTPTAANHYQPSQNWTWSPAANTSSPEGYASQAPQPWPRSGPGGHSQQPFTQLTQSSTGFYLDERAPLPSPSYAPPVQNLTTTTSGLPQFAHRTFPSVTCHNHHSPYHPLPATASCGQGLAGLLPTYQHVPHAPGAVVLEEGGLSQHASGLQPSIPRASSNTSNTISTVHQSTRNSAHTPGDAGMAPSSSISQPSNSMQPLDGSTTAQADTASKAANGRRPKKLNLHTVKFHALGHYPAVIRHFGPSDLYSTEWGEYFHKSPKAWTKRTSRRQLRMELSRHERRRKRIQLTKYRLLSTGKTAKSQEFREQRLAARNPDIHHFIGMSTRLYTTLGDFAQGGRFARDIAAHMFVRNLKQYLLPRFISTVLPHLEGPSLENFVQGRDWSRLVLKKDRVYTHQIMRIKYTTYDTRRDEDIIHLDTAQCNIMLLNPQYARSTPLQHPFRYGKVMAICHVDVGYVGDMGLTGSQFTHHRVEFLWVRWYRVHPASTAFQLDQVELRSLDEPGSHSFIDPLDVLRACHIIPCYRLGKQYPDGRGKSEIWQDGSDWKRYYVNRFVDRDMFMRYEWGLAVGHTYTHADSVSAFQGILGGEYTRKGVQDGPASAVPSAVASRNSPPGAVEPVGGVPETGRMGPQGSFDGTQSADAGINSGGCDAEGSNQDAIDLNDDDGEDDGRSDDGSIDTDATSMRGFSDEEEERMISLFGRDY